MQILNTSVLEDPVFLPQNPAARRLSEHKLKKIHYSQGSILSSREPKQNRRKQNKNWECESDGSQKSVWEQICQEKNVVDRCLTRKRGCELAPHPPPLTPGVTKAAAVAEVKSSGTVKVFFLRQWERPRPSGMGVEKWQHCTWTCALGKLKRPNQTQMKSNSYPQELGPPMRTTWEGSERCWIQAASRYSRGLLAAQRGWSERRMPIEMKDISVRAISGLSPTYGNSQFLG